MEQLRDDQLSKLQQLQLEARQTFPEDALFTYTHNGDAYTLTLSEAIDICGRHIANFPVDKVIDMLQGMYQDASLLAKYDELRPGEGRLDRSIERGQAKREQALARRALENFED